MSRPHYPTKAAWAAARAAELQREARLLPIVSVHDWRGVQRRTRAVRSLAAEARRFEMLAERFRAQGA